MNILHTFTIVLIILIGLEHVGIMGLELLGSDRLIAKSFNLPLAEVERPYLRTALANQGLYNGFVALSLFLIIFIPGGTLLRGMAIGLLAGIFIIAAYGALTVAKRILWIQGAPALITMVLAMFFL